MKHSLIRQTIVETASRLFYQHGYNLTGINEIIKEAGIAKATLYNHFESKDDICLAYLDHKNEIFMEQISSFVSKKKKGTAQLLAIFDFLKQFYSAESFNGCWCINTLSEVPFEKVEIRNKIKHQKNGFLHFITELAMANFPDNSKRENTLIAKRIYLLYEGALSESNIHREAWPIADARALAKQIL